MSNNEFENKEFLELTGHTSYIRSALFSPDSKTAVTASDDKTAKLWNAANGECLRTFTGHKLRLLSAAFSPDGKMIIRADDSTAGIYRI